MTDQENANGHHETETKPHEQERLMVLDMLNTGKITMDEAEKLLGTLSKPTDEVEAVTPSDSNEEALPDLDLPNLERLWMYPFGIGITSLVSFWWLFRKVGGLLGFVFFFPLVVFSGVLTVVGFTSRHGHWLHIRIQAKDGTKIKFSIPLPLQLSSQILKRLAPVITNYTDEAMPFSPEDMADMINMMGDELSAENPLIVRVDEGNEKVLVYIT